MEGRCLVKKLNGAEAERSERLSLPRLSLSSRTCFGKLRNLFFYTARRLFISSSFFNYRSCSSLKFEHRMLFSNVNSFFSILYMSVRSCTGTFCTYGGVKMACSRGSGSDRMWTSGLLIMKLSKFSMSMSLMSRVSMFTRWWLPGWWWWWWMPLPAVNCFRFAPPYTRPCWLCRFSRRRRMLAISAYD